MKTLEQLIEDARAQRAALEKARQDLEAQRAEQARRQKVVALQVKLSDWFDPTFLDLIEVEVCTQDVYPQAYGLFEYAGLPFCLWYTEGQPYGAQWLLHRQHADSSMVITIKAVSHDKDQVLADLLCALGDLSDHLGGSR